jgi:branched-chain amino acid transport system substrate-binding protein
MKFFVLLVLFTSFSFSSYAADNSVKVGVALRFTPDANSFAGALYQGIEYAAQVFSINHPELNIELVKYSHKNDHASVDDAAKTILEDKVHFVIGGEMSDDAFALAESFHDKKVLFMSPTASNPFLTAGNPFVFRACLPDDQVAIQMADYVSSLKQIKSVGVIHDTSSAYTDYLTNAFLDAYGAKNPKMKITEFRYAGDQPDFRGALKEFKNASVDFVVAFTLQEHLKAFYQLASHAKFNPQYLGGDGWGTGLQKWIGNDFRGIRNSYWSSESKDQSVVQFKSGFEKKYGNEPDGWNAAAYDAAMILFEAIAKAKKPIQVSDVAEILHTTPFHKTVTAHELKFNSKNSIQKPLYLYEVRKSGMKLIKEMK